LSPASFAESEDDGDFGLGDAGSESVVGEGGPSIAAESPESEFDFARLLGFDFAEISASQLGRMNRGFLGWRFCLSKKMSSWDASLLP
jgi:hypothetical protein